MGEINLLESLPKTKRNLVERAALSTAEDKLLAKQFGKEFFDGNRNQGYGGYHYDGRWKSVAKRFQEYYGLQSNSRILDIGCAKGFLLHDLQEEIPGVQVAGIDISAYAIENALESVKPYVQVANAKALPFPDKSFDLVISINTIHNLAQDELKIALREMERVSCRDKFLVLDAYRTPEERDRLLQWNLTALTHHYVSDWELIFQEVGYLGDYFWFTP